MLCRIFAWLLCLFTLSAHAATSSVVPLPLEGKTQGMMIVDSRLPLVTLQLTFRYSGGVSDPADKSGRAYLAAQLLTEGAGEYDGQAFRRMLEAKAIKLGAGASQDNLAISLKTLSQHLPEAVRLLTLILTRPRFDADALARKQEEIRADLRAAGSDPGWQASRKWHELAYGQHPYARPLEGTEKTITALTVQDARNWREQTLTRDRLLISAVGDVKPAELTRLLQPLLRALPEKSPLPSPPPAPQVPVNLPPVTVTQNVPQSIALFGFPAMKRDHPDFYAAFLLNHILGGGTLTSRLSHAIREEKGLAYYVNTSLMPQLCGGVLIGSFATRNAQIGAAVEELKQVLRFTAEKGIAAAELRHAKDYLTGSFPLELDSQSARASYLSSMLLHQLDADYLAKRNGYFKAVTLTQVNHIAKQMFSHLPLLVVAGKPEKPLE